MRSEDHVRRLYTTLTLLTTTALVGWAGPVPYGTTPYTKVCPQGEKIFTVLKFTDANEGGNRIFFYPRCIKFQPAECTRGCEWTDSCSNLASGGSDVITSSQAIYLAGLRIGQSTNGTDQLEKFCCESLARRWVEDSCRQQTEELGTAPTDIAGKNQVILDAQFTGTHIGESDSITFDVCDISEEYHDDNRCRNPSPGDPDFDGANRLIGLQ